SLGLVVNVVATISLVDLAVGSRVVRLVGFTAIAVWLAICAEGIDRVTTETLINGNGYSSLQSTLAANLLRFVVTYDLEPLATKHCRRETRSCGGRTRGSAGLRHPYTRGILPRALHEPVRLDRAVVTNEAFVQNGAYQTTPVDPLRPAWGSYTPQANPAQGRI